MRILTALCVTLLLCTGCADAEKADSVDACEAADAPCGEDCSEAVDLYEDATETGVDVPDEVTAG